MNRRLTRCRENRMIAGVAAGVAEYFGIDPSIVRLLWLASVFFGGIGILLYIAMIFIVPLEPLTPEALAAQQAAAAHGVSAGHRHEPGAGTLMTFVGFVLLAFGAIALIDAVLPNWATWRQLWPLVFIAAGGFLLAISLRRNREAGDGGPPAPPPAGPAGPVLGNGTTAATPTES